MLTSDIRTRFDNVYFQLILNLGRMWKETKTKPQIDSYYILKGNPNKYISPDKLLD